MPKKLCNDEIIIHAYGDSIETYCTLEPNHNNKNHKVDNPDILIQRYNKNNQTFESIKAIITWK
jgi:hypothetical protein